MIAFIVRGGPPAAIFFYKMSTVDSLIAKAFSMPIAPLATKDPADGKRSQRIATLALYVVLMALAIWIIRSFIPSIVWALVIAIVVWPLLQRVSSPRQSATRANLVAFALTTVVGVFVVLPFVLLFTEVLHETHQLIHWVKDIVQNGFAMPPFVEHLPFGNQIASWWEANLSRPLQGSPAMEALRGGHVATAGRHFGTAALKGLMHFGFMLLTLFVLLRSGPRVAEQALKGVRRVFGADGTHLAVRMTAAVRATVTGLVVVGLGEGALIGASYFATGLPHAAELGLVTAVAAMLPFCAPIAFGGAALWLLTHGQVMGAVAVLATGAVVVFIAEHFVRPGIIGSTTRLPFLLVLFGILGGAETFGLVGLFIGPALMTVLTLLWREALR
jgi:predicted PurR-regulated permease PerM